MNASFTTSGINFANINVLIGKDVLTDICQAYRKHRSEKMKAGLALDTLAPQKPLKAQTIARKRGIHKTTGKRAGSAIKIGKRKAISSSPETPLVDTGNMAEGTMFIARDGYAEIFQGKQREKIVEYHQFGEGSNPVRVSMAFNKEFVETKAVPLLQMWLKKAVENA